MSWTNGNVLIIKGVNNKEVRCLVQDGHLTILADGAIISPETMDLLSQYLAEGARELTEQS